MHFDSAGAEPATARGLQLAQPANRHRQHHGSRLAGQQANPSTEARQLPFRRARAFGEDHHVESAVHGRSGVGETPLEVPQAGQREDVEERRQQDINQRPKRIEAPFPRRAIWIAEVPVVLQHLPGHGHGNPPPHRSRQGVLNQRAVVGRDVIGNNKHWLIRVRQLRRNHTRMRQQPHQRPLDRLNKSHSKPPEGPKPRPARVDVFVRRGVWLLLTEGRLGFVVSSTLG